MKYMGSKSRIAKYIVPIIQSYIDNYNIKTYVEPFCGGTDYWYLPNELEKGHMEWVKDE